MTTGRRTIMKKITSPLLCASLVTAVLFPPVVCAQEGAASETPRSDKLYIGLLVTALEHRSICISKEDGWGQAGTLVIGGHLNDHRSPAYPPGPSRLPWKCR